VCALRDTCRAHLYVNAVHGHTARFTFVSTRKPLNSIALTGILCGHRRKYKLHTGRVGPTVLTDIKITLVICYTFGSLERRSYKFGDFYFMDWTFIPAAFTYECENNSSVDTIQKGFIFNHAGIEKMKVLIYIDY
jgi:hypothetical protein